MASRFHNGGGQFKRGVRNSRATRQWPQNGGEGPHPRVDFNKMKVSGLPRADLPNLCLCISAAGSFSIFAQMLIARYHGCEDVALLTLPQVASLRRYIQHNEIQEVDPQSPKDELVAAVSRHWYSSVVKEEMVLYNLVTAFKKAHADRRT